MWIPVVRPLRSLWNGIEDAMISNMNASTNGIVDAITASQVRAGRALLGWSQDQLVDASGVPKRTLARFELGEGVPQRRTLASVRTALETAGVVFIAENGGGPGVRLRQGQH